ncbi:hypothetical protein PR048_027373 [Dryococelus australis]|uniref:Fibronectin type-III domain-containing protein n=1 Tax=Dryococelus australis TaxID=614101 RepID=A0ABQ9GFA0_9NEOP|nr:hypothetical protein PR048_027373 [Dryococelus australis]
MVCFFFFSEIGAITDLTIHQWNNSTVTLDIVFPNNTTKCITEFTTCLYETDNEDTEKYCRFMRTEWINRTQSCTNYTLDITAISYDKQTTNGSITFVTGAAQVSDVIPNVSPSGKAVTVTWTFPESNVRCVSYHVVSFIRAEDNLVLIRRNVSKEGTRSSYGGLFFCNSYKVEVQPITLDDESPPAVTALFHTPSNGECLLYSFTPPAMVSVYLTLPHPAMVTVYLTHPRPDNDECILDSSTPPAMVSVFNCNLHAPSNVRSLTGLSVTGIKSDALHVSYTIAETSSNCVHHFQICWEARGVNKSCTNEQGYSSSSVNITGLTPATNYTVEVTPVAPDGQKYVTSTVSGCTLPSSESASMWILSIFLQQCNLEENIGLKTFMNIIFLCADVTMVTDVTVAVHEGGRSVRVSWTIPQKDVESAGEWLITCSRLKDDVAVLEKAVSWTTTSLAIGNLETCVSYSANVQLVNSDLSSTDEASVPFITSGKDGHC